MLKYLTALICISVAVFQESDKLALVVLPKASGDALQSVNVKECLDPELYTDEERVLNIDTEEEYLCSFISYQANKDTSAHGYQVYADKEEATMRYAVFKKCVDNVNHINSQNLSWKAGVNFLCDRTDEEFTNNYHGLIMPPEEGKEGKEGEVVLGGAPPPGFGAPPPQGAPPGGQGSGEEEEKLSRVVMPEVGGDAALTTVDPKQCLDKDLYKNTANVLDIDSEGEYLCAFISFQANKPADEGLYASKEEATMRYGLFKKCVDEVNKVNSQDLTWTAGVNFFCDMTKEERYPYSHGIARGGGNKRMGLGAPAPGN